MSDIAITILVKFDGNFELKCKELGIVLINDNVFSLLQDFVDEVRFLIKEYMLEDDHRLTGDAIRLKKRLRQFFG